MDMVVSTLEYLTYLPTTKQVFEYRGGFSTGDAGMVWCSVVWYLGAGEEDGYLRGGGPAGWLAGRLASDRLGVTGLGEEGGRVLSTYKFDYH